jgi:adenylate cyclase
VLTAAAIAAVLQLILQRLAGFELASGVFTAIMMLLAAIGCVYLITRTTVLVGDVSAEQLRRERLGRHFSPEVAALLAAGSADTVTGATCDVTVLFGDLRDFTAASARLTAPEVVALLNEFHTRMVETIFACGGTLDKYLGDGLMVYFGAPVAQADHPERAVRCAVAMQAELAHLNTLRASRGEPALQMGIGIHTGEVVVGDIGHPRRREYTVIGDPVNVAARLQVLTKTEHAPILVSASTRRRLPGTLPMVAAGTIAVRGKPEPLDVYVPVPEGAIAPARITR